MTREAIRERLADLNRQLEQHIANANACKGAIQDCEYWLERMEAEQKPKLSRVEDRDEEPIHAP